MNALSNPFLTTRASMHPQTRKRAKRLPLLKNTHVCGKTHEKTLGNELSVSMDTVFELNELTLPFFISKFNYANGLWFKFIVINHNSRHRVFVCNGSLVTRHSVIYIEAMMDLIKREQQRENANANANEDKLMELYEYIIACKTSKKGLVGCPDIKLAQAKFSKEFKKHFNCMEVVSAGSGTVFHDILNTNVTICLNTKSGHYRPTLKHIDLAKEIVENIVANARLSGRLGEYKIGVTSQYKPRKSTLKRVFGKNAHKLGICIPSQSTQHDIANK
jgi:hypothetical protein